MKSTLGRIFFGLILIFLITPQAVYGQPINDQKYYRGEVFWIIKEHEVSEEINKEINKGMYEQKFKVRILEGELKDKEVIMDYQGMNLLAKDQLFKEGDEVIVASSLTIEGKEVFSVADRVRSKALVILALVYSIAIIGLARFKGLKSLIGLGMSFLVVIKFIVPQILAGGNPLWISILGSVGIVSITLYLIYGLNKQTTVSLVSTILSLMLTGFIAVLVTKITKLTGLGSEEAMFLQYSQQKIASMKGLLLGGIMIGALGVIDDITVTQAAIVFELRRANKKLSIKQLYSRGLKVGKDHIASMTNTLVLAYTGASLPLFLLFYNNQVVPGWVAINSEIIVEEVVTTLVGSLGLIASVPIATYLAAVVASKHLKSIK